MTKGNKKHQVRGPHFEVRESAFLLATGRLEIDREKQVNLRISVDSQRKLLAHTFHQISSGYCTAVSLKKRLGEGNDCKLNKSQSFVPGSQCRRWKAWNSDGVCCRGFSALSTELSIGQKYMAEGSADKALMKIT